MTCSVQLCSTRANSALRIPMMVMSFTIATTVTFLTPASWRLWTKEAVLHVKSLEELTSLFVNSENGVRVMFAAGQTIR